MKSQKGFTIIELIIIIVIAAVASVFFFIQKNDIEIAARDTTRKTAINAFYYSLEEVYYKEHGAYPRTISSENLPSVEASLFKDPTDIKIGEGESDYRYEATDCTDDSCKSYTLRALLEAEEDFVKKSRN